MTCPLRLSSGPPLLPGLIAASVCSTTRAGAPNGADDAAGHGILKDAERQADGDDFLARAHAVDRAERQHRL